MEISFTKMNGAGNDFIVIDNRDGRYDALDENKIAWLCDRHRGVGADGLLAVEPARDGSTADFTFRYYNADGGEAEMCGNGARCFGRFTRDLLGGTAESIAFDTIAGRITARFPGENIQIQLSEPRDFCLGMTVELPDGPSELHFVNTGVPHAVMLVDDLETVDVRRLGAAIRFHTVFAPKGTNANFQNVLGPGEIKIRTYERGVEDETLACGTGIVANALVHYRLTGAPPPIRVWVRGGDMLEVGFKVDEAESYTDVTLTGPADYTFSGTIRI